MASGEQYILTPAQIQSYLENGYLHIPALLTQEELLHFEPVYQKLLEGKVQGVKNDYADSDGISKPVQDFKAPSVMQPSKYCPELIELGKPYYNRSVSIAQQLEGTDMNFEYDRIIAKKPEREDAEFKFHQDKYYCKISCAVETEDDRALTMFLALDDTTLENGCIQYVPGSHRGKIARKHVPVYDDQHSQQLMVTQTLVDESKEKIVPVPLKRGDAVVHHHYTVHGSGGNSTKGWRRSFLLGFRPKQVIELAKQLETRSINNNL